MITDMQVFDDFDGSLDRHWTQVTTGGARLENRKSILRLGFDSAREGKYTDAQIDDYTMLAKGDYLWKPPLRMTVRARFSHAAATADSTDKTKGVLRGTAGFGFWNRPFTMQGNWFTLPESIWFFYSAPPSNMALVPGVPGWGWKAQVVHAMRPGAIPSGLVLAATALYGRLTGHEQPAGRWMQRLAGAHEAVIESPMTDWHTYTLEWHRDKALFWVDGDLVLQTPQTPFRPLGFVAWLDNEFAVATPMGELRFGKGKSGAQWLDLDSVKIERL